MNTEIAEIKNGSINDIHLTFRLSYEQCRHTGVIGILTSGQRGEGIDQIPQVQDGDRLLRWTI
jgi:hypothetical protein